MILIIDNYDSYTYNLFQCVGTLEPDILVYRNDKITVQEIRKMKPERIIISPGPGYPGDAGICIELIREFYKELPILGVCLGHQSIGEAMGGKTVHASRLMHGKTDRIKIVDKSSRIFSGFVGDTAEVGRYHSLVTDKNCLPECLKVTAVSGDGAVMAMEHKEYPLFGMQFHPESVLTPDGPKMIENFLRI